MRRKPLNPDSAQAEGVDYLLREFKALRTATPSTTVAATTGNGGPIEPTFLVASVDARDEIKAVADFVCDGVNDEEEILAAVAAIDALAIPFPSDKGKIVLTGGNFKCEGPINLDGCELVGNGMWNTWLEFYDGAYGVGVTSYCISTSTIGAIRHLSIWSDNVDVAPSPQQTVYVPDGGTLDTVYVQGDLTDPDEIALYVVKAASATITNCYLYSGPSRFVGIEGATLYIDGDYQRPSIVSNNYIDPAYHADHGIVVTGRTSIVGNQLRRMADSGIYVTGDHNLINSNHITDPSEYGIKLTSTADNNIVTGNIVVDDQDTGYFYDAVYVSAGAEYNMVGPNKVDDKHGHVTDSVTDLGTGTILISGTTGVLASVVKHDNFNQSGALTIGSGTVRYYTQTDRTITGVYAMVSGAPVTSPAIFDVNMDGATTIFTTQANRPEIAAAAFLSAVEVPDVTAWDAGSYLLIDVDAANSATDLILVVEYTEA